jgi:hypothetical protein
VEAIASSRTESLQNDEGLGGVESNQSCRGGANLHSFILQSLADGLGAASQKFLLKQMPFDEEFHPAVHIASMRCHLMKNFICAKHAPGDRKRGSRLRFHLF